MRWQLVSEDIFFLHSRFLYTSIFCLLITSCCSFLYIIHNSKYILLYIKNKKNSVHTSFCMSVHTCILVGAYNYIFSAHACSFKSWELSRKRQVVQDIYKNILMSFIWVHTLWKYVVNVFTHVQQNTTIYYIKLLEEVRSYTFSPTKKVTINTDSSMKPRYSLSIMLFFFCYYFIYEYFCFSDSI